MSRGGARAGFAGAVLAAALAAPGSWGQPPGSIPPVYSQRLQVPVRGDELRQPRAVVADLHSGEVFVCDTLANRIVIFDSQGRFRYEIRGGSAFQSPLDLAVDPEGYLFVVSQVSSEVTLLDFDGRLLSRSPLTGLPAEAISPRFASLAISPAGDRLYLMDFENDRLWITDRRLAVLGSVDTTIGRTPKEIEELRYGKVDVYGETVVLPIPNDGLVHLFDLDGKSQGTLGEPGAGECQLLFPVAAALDERGRALILDQQRAIFTTWDRARGACLSEHYGFGNVPGAFYQPSDMALDTAGRLYVSQGFEGRVQVYDGARPAPLRIAARQPEPEISEETLIADAATGAAPEPGAVTETATTHEAVPAAGPEATGPEPPAAEDVAAATPAEPAPPEVRETVARAAGPEPAEPVAGEATAEVVEAVRAWAGAWAGKRIEEYLASYSSEFRPNRELSHSQWEDLRRIRLDRPRFIEVSLADIEISWAAPDRAQASFVQTYRSNLFADKVDKILILKREADGWKILFERVVRTYRE